MLPANHSPTILLIGGSDASGGAGIQADLRVLAAYRMAGACAVTAVTAQNSHGLLALQPVPARQVARQIEAALADMEIAAVKIGLLAGATTTRMVAELLAPLGLPIVLDPVLVAGAGGRLLDPAALPVLLGRLLPLATVLTPNLPEAVALLERPIHGLAGRLRAARALHQRGAQTVLLKGGHGRGTRLIDIVLDAEGSETLLAERLPLLTHGTGCTYASAIAAGLARGSPPRQAIRDAHQYLQDALRQPLLLGNARRACPGLATPAGHLAS